MCGRGAMAAGATGARNRVTRVRTGGVRTARKHVAAGTFLVRWRAFRILLAGPLSRPCASSTPANKIMSSWRYRQAKRWRPYSFSCAYLMRNQRASRLLCKKRCRPGPWLFETQLRRISGLSASRSRRRCRPRADRRPGFGPTSVSRSRLLQHRPDRQIHRDHDQ